MGKCTEGWPGVLWGASNLKVWARMNPTQGGGAHTCWAALAKKKGVQGRLGRADSSARRVWYRAARAASLRYPALFTYYYQEGVQ